MAYIFDGKAFALKKEQYLIKKAETLRKSGKVPKLVSILVGDDPASVLYVNLKKKAVERVGAVAEIVKIKKTVSKKEILETIQKFNKENSVNGIMIQLPLPNKFTKGDRDEILNSISPQKDVDGLRSDSKFTAPTAKAVLEVLDEAINIVRPIMNESTHLLVVGSSGFEGKKIITALNNKFPRLKLLGADAKTKDLFSVTKASDILVSVTGVAGLIKENMVKEGAILIDVGSPKGDVQKEAYEKASFVSPVPGGVGPMTISCLLENLI